MNTDPIVYVVDDEAAVRKTLQIVAESAGKTVKLYESAEDFLGDYQGDESGCLMLDLRLGGISGIQLLDTIQSRNGWLPVIIFTGHGDISAAVECMKKGAMDFIEKPLDPNILLAKIETAYERSRKMRAERTTIKDAQKRLETLTRREREMLKLMISGKSSKQIARDAGLALKTVCNHRAHLLAKTGAENTADLVRLAMLGDAEFREMVEPAEGEPR